MTRFKACRKRFFVQKNNLLCGVITIIYLLPIEMERPRTQIVNIKHVWYLQLFIRQPLKYSLSLRRHAHGTLAKCLMQMAHLSGNTSGVSKSSSDWLNYTGFPGDVCVAFFNVAPGNKTKPPHERRKLSCLQLTMSACQDQLNAEFSKVCEKFKVCGIESLKYVREFYTPVCYCGDISTPRNMTRHKMKRD